eukprot:TRINITY_DN1040_c0_g1_i2.p1 TRINITY_DN1040_c0_g1~~TRINITY_DN1040_c0_g1_i2.p1  ORF type:complete len:455 (+),score=189.31 TRINITY_DN1040_c0_g1_i2:45-1409(+)
MSCDSLDWKFSQVFGDSPSKTPIEVTDVDIVSAIEFDSTGDFIAAGDRGGRVVVFKQNENKKYKFYAEFQSHEPEFDYLKSLEIEEKINKIKWRKTHSDSLFLLTANDKTIKLWNVHQKRVKSFSRENNYIGERSASEKREKAEPNPDARHKGASAPEGPIVIPKVSVQDSIVAATPRKVYSNAHAYHINSISLNSDGETYISSDDLRINLWNLGISDQSFNIVDIKPPNMEELTEVITSAEFHPTHCNLFMYSSSKGTIKLGDMRAAALCDSSAKVFEEEEDPGSKSFFSEIISSISDIKFSRDGRYILSRDYLTLKVWDLNMESKPVKTIRIHDYLRSKLCDLYENDCIFDKFECNFSPTGEFAVTGSYNNLFSVHELQGKGMTPLEATKSNPNKPKKGKTSSGARNSLNPDNIDFNKKCLHITWHPFDNIVAVGASNNMFIFTADATKSAQ